MAFVCAASIIGIPAYADKFTSAQVLEWSKESQDSFFQTSISMAGAVASINERQKARCIDNWYFDLSADRAANNEYIRSIFRRYPDDFPTALILAIVQKKCGSMEFRAAG